MYRVTLTGVKRIFCYTEDFVIERFVISKFGNGSDAKRTILLLKLKSRFSDEHSIVNYGNPVS